MLLVTIRLSICIVYLPKFLMKQGNLRTNDGLQVYPECEEFREAAIEAGEVVWKRGLLRRLGLCHGISGNAYVFLSLYRLSGGKQHLHRAQQFSTFLYKNAKELIATGELHGGDHGYSLYEGLAGTACLWLDLTRPDSSRFPGYEL